MKHGTELDGKRMLFGNLRWHASSSLADCWVLRGNAELHFEIDKSIVHDPIIQTKVHCERQRQGETCSIAPTFKRDDIKK